MLIYGTIANMRNKFIYFPLVSIVAVASIALAITSSWPSNASTKVHRMTTFVGGDIHTLTYTKNGLFVTGHESGSVSANGGYTWSAIPSFRNADIMGWATTDIGFLAGGHNGMFKSTDGGKSFARINFFGKVSDVHSLGASGKNVYLASPQAGLLRSIDSGKSWKLVNKKFGQGFMGSMLVDSKNPLRVIAPDMSNGLVVTKDGGKTWAHFGGPSGVMSVDWNAKNQKEIVVLAMGVGAITKNNGRTWNSFPVPMSSSAIALSSTGSKIFVAVLSGSKAKIQASDNMGKSWT